jgi:hypothetical protein
VNLNYFVNAQSFARPMMPVAQPGLMWLDGVFTVNYLDGQERLLAHYERHLDLETTAEQGIALFNDATGTFQRFQTYSPGNTLVPQGHAFRHRVGGQDYIYFSQTYVNVRVKADWPYVTNIAQWEAFTPLRENSTYDPANPPLELDPSGRPVFGWKKNAAPLSYDMLEDLVQRGHLQRDQLPFRLQELTTGDAVRLHRSSVQWNDYRQAWILIGTEAWGDSFLGEVWFAEAPTPEGPWVNAVKVASHDRGAAGDYTFYNPSLHPYFDQAGGRFIYFEGTYANTFSGNPNQTPLYDYNQMMYRLDLATIPHLFPRLPGDYNASGAVDAADYILWRNTLGQTGLSLAADGNLNNRIDAGDYDVWRAHFGETAGNAGESARLAPTVPEPATGITLLALVCGWHARRLRDGRGYRQRVRRATILSRRQSPPAPPQLPLCRLAACGGWSATMPRC